MTEEKRERREKRLRSCKSCGKALYYYRVQGVVRANHNPDYDDIKQLPNTPRTLSRARHQVQILCGV